MRADNNARYRLIKAGEHGKSMFVDITNDATVETLRNRSGNRNLLISACYYTASDSSAERIYPLRVHIVSSDLEKARVSALETCYYINERFGIPTSCLEIIYTGGGNITSDAAIDTNSADIADNYIAGDNSQSTGTEIMGTATAAEIIITIPPFVFGGQPTRLMPALNYHLARQMTEDGIQNIDIDVYTNIFVPLPNSIRIATGRYVLPIEMKELLYLDMTTLVELSKQPKAEVSLIIPRLILAAAEWFNETLVGFEKKQRRQDELRTLMLQKGWQIPPCIRRLSWADLAKDATFEACRVISGTYSFLGSHEDEIWYHILRLARRNSIQGVREHQRLSAIITFALENPMLPECSHPLVKRFCPAGGCYISELLEECRQPGLFEDLSKAHTQL